MKFYGPEWIDIWANQKMSIHRLYNNRIEIIYNTELYVNTLLYCMLSPANSGQILKSSHTKTSVTISKQCHVIFFV